jgi:hypothetical protein
MGILLQEDHRPEMREEVRCRSTGNSPSDNDEIRAHNLVLLAPQVPSGLLGSLERIIVRGVDSNKWNPLSNYLQTGCRARSCKQDPASLGPAFDYLRGPLGFLTSTQVRIRGNFDPDTDLELPANG